MVNYDRGLVGQTGDGHFSPITGYHENEDKSLVLDVARYKYPSHWMDIQTMHAGLAKVDPQSNFPRGMVVLSRSTEIYPELCRLTPDYALSHDFSNYFRTLESKDRFDQVRKLESTQRPKAYLELLSSSPSKIYDHLTAFCLQISQILETKRHDLGALTIDRLRDIEASVPGFSRVNLWDEELKALPIAEILRDILPESGSSVLALWYIAMEDDLLHTHRLKNSSLSNSIPAFWDGPARGH